MQKLVRFDWAIKYLLKNKANFVILEGFLAELLKFDLKIQTVLDSESNKHTDDDKYNRVDVLVETKTKEKIIIEVQVSAEFDFLSRILYSTSKTIVEHLKEGEKYKKISKVISVNILFFDLGEGKDYIYHGTTKFVGVHYNDKLKLRKNEKLFYADNKNRPEDIYPEYYILKVNQFHKTIKNKFDEWMYFLKHEAIKADFTARGIKEANSTLDILKLPKKQRENYDHYLKKLHHESSMIESRYFEGRITGHEEGLEKGIEQGIEQTKILITKNLLQANMNLTKIAQTTGLSLEQIKKIQFGLNQK